VRYRAGQVLLRRHWMRDVLGRVWVGRVAADDERGLALWIKVGSAFRDVAAVDGRTFRQVPFVEWPATAKSLRDLRWRGYDVLMLHPAGAAYSVWLFFGAAGEFRNWYVNLERPYVRWADDRAAGIDTVDYDLDLVVEPDRSWRWKDEDEFTAFLAHPEIYWVDDGDAVWQSGWEVVKLIEAGAYPFDGTWCDFRPDPRWSMPAAPPGWDRPRPW
jgi:hypothetical protein